MDYWEWYRQRLLDERSFQEFMEILNKGLDDYMERLDEYLD